MGASITPTNTGGSSGIAFDAVEVDAGASLVFDATHSRGGGLAAKHVAGLGQDSYYGWSSTFGERNLWFGRVYVWFDGPPPGGVQLLSGYGDGALGYTFEITQAGRLRIADGADRAIAITASAIAARGWVRIEWKVDHRTGVVQLKLFNKAKSSTPTETVTSAAGQPIGAVTDGFDLGPCGTQGNPTTFWTDDLAAGWTAYVGSSR